MQNPWKEGKGLTWSTKLSGHVAMTLIRMSAGTHFTQRIIYKDVFLSCLLAVNLQDIFSKTISQSDVTWHDIWWMGSQEVLSDAKWIKLNNIASTDVKTRQTYTPAHRRSRSQNSKTEFMISWQQFMCYCCVLFSQMVNHITFFLKIPFESQYNKTVQPEVQRKIDHRLYLEVSFSINYMKRNIRLISLIIFTSIKNNTQQKIRGICHQNKRHRITHTHASLPCSQNKGSISLTKTFIFHYLFTSLHFLHLNLTYFPCL